MSEESPCDCGCEYCCGEDEWDGVPSPLPPKGTTERMVYDYYQAAMLRELSKKLRFAEMMR